MWRYPSAAEENQVRRTGWRGLFLAGLLCGCMACGAVFEPEVRNQVDPTLSYPELAASPEAHVGRVVMLGGAIVEAVNFATYTRITLLQYPLDRRHRPRAGQASGGRFLLRVPGYLETEVYRPGRALSVIGDVVGREALPLGETTYAYPVLAPKAFHLWREGDIGPRFSVGFGMGFSKGW